MKKTKEDKTDNKKKPEKAKLEKKEDTAKSLRKPSTPMGFHGEDEERNLNAEE